jgi:hypothetical protein
MSGEANHHGHRQRLLSVFDEKRTACLAAFATSACATSPL